MPNRRQIRPAASRRLVLRCYLSNQGHQFLHAQDGDHALAYALSLTPAHVNRTLVDLRKRALIEFVRDEMRLLDQPALREIAEER